MFLKSHSLKTLPKKTPLLISFRININIHYLTILLILHQVEFNMGNKRLLIKYMPIKKRFVL